MVQGTGTTVASVVLALTISGTVGDACAAQPAPATPARAPFVRVVGTAQDGGLPHVACTGEHCRRARAEPAFRRRVASLSLVLPASGRVFLFDATPDLPEQLDALADVRRPSAGRVDREPIDGVFLTHAHMGHYLGLALLGFEAVHVQGLPVWGTPTMLALLRSDAPWSQLVARGNIDLHELAPGAGVELGEGVAVSALAVPHRDELSDTVGFRIDGPGRTVLYVPDTDGWERWEPPLEERLDGVDVALLDGTFFSPDELPGRDVATIGHPLIRDTIARLAGRVAAGGLEVLFTHLNHSNPAVDPASPEHARILAAGFGVAREGLEISLGAAAAGDVAAAVPTGDGDGDGDG